MLDSFKIILAVCCLFALFVAIAFFLSKGECNAKAHYMQLEHEFTFFGGCMIKTKSGDWIQMKSYIVNKEEK